MDVATDALLHLNAEELRGMVQSLRQTVTFKQATIDKLKTCAICSSARLRHRWQPQT